MKKFNTALLVFIFAVVFLVGCKNGSAEKTVSVAQPSAAQQTNGQDHQLVPIKIGERSLTVEVVTTAESITLGLGGRTEIGSDGMLFVMPERRVAHYWMHGMKFPLDFVWIDDTKVVGLIENVPAPIDPNSYELPSYSSEVPVTHVLELPVGKIDELKITVGMPVEKSL